MAVVKENAEDMINIRIAEKADTPQILTFIEALADYEKLSDACVATVEDLERTLFGDKPFANVLIAELEGKPIGFALYFYNYSTFLAKPGIWLEDLFVLPEYRGRSAGKKLLLELVNIAKRSNFGRVEWSVLDWNTPSIEFYKSLGAIPMDEWTNYRLTESSFDLLS